MAYMSLYRKWRPQTFADVVGQTQAVQTIRNALDHNRLSHAYLFAGPRGVGKTTVARLIAKGLNCVNGPTSNPCNQCAACERITKGLSMDVIEIDAASNRGIDEIRDLRDNVRFAPTEGKYKVYIIDEVHMLTTDAFNALLKTLEEPPEHVVFILATTEPHKIPATILSRCQRYDFRSLTEAEMVERLAYVASQEGIQVTRQALTVIAKHAAGGMRDALGLLDQCAAFGEGAITEQVVANALGIVPQEQLWKFVSLLAKGEAGACIQLLQEIIFMGKDLRQFAKDTAAMFRMILMAKLGQDMPGCGDDVPPDFQTLQDALSIEQLVEILEQMGRLDNEIRLAADERIPLELGIIRITSLVKKSTSANHGSVNSEVQELRQQVRQLQAAVKALEGRLNTLVSQQGRSASSSAAAYDAEAVVPTATERNVTGAVDNVANEPAVASGVPDASGLGEEERQESRSSLRAAGDNGTVSAARLEKIKEIWDTIFDVLKQERQASLGAFLREAQPAAVTSDGRLLLAFPYDRGFHKASVEQPKMKDLLERVIARLTGEKYVVQCEFGTCEEVAARYGAVGIGTDSVDAVSSEAAELGREENSSAGEEVASDPGLAATAEQGRPEAESAADHSVQNDLDVDLGEQDPIVQAALNIFKGKLIKLK